MVETSTVDAANLGSIRVTVGVLEGVRVLLTECI